MAQGFGQTLRGFPRAGKQQDARGILIQPVHQLGLVVEAVAQRLGHLIHVAQLLRSALRRQPRRLVDGDNVVIAVDHGGADHLGVGVADMGVAAMHGGRGCVGQRRDTNLLPLFNAGRGFHATAIDADLALATHLSIRPCGTCG